MIAGLKQASHSSRILAGGLLSRYSDVPPYKKQEEKIATEPTENTEKPKKQPLSRWALWFYKCGVIGFDGDFCPLARVRLPHDNTPHARLPTRKPLP